MSWVIKATHYMNDSDYYMCRDARWKSPNEAYNKQTFNTKADAEFVLSSLPYLRYDMYTISIEELP